MTIQPDPTLEAARPIDMILFCPACHAQHVDEPDERTPDWVNPPHRSHLCHACGTIWRPADLATNGVKAIQTRGKADTLSLPEAPPATLQGEGETKAVEITGKAISDALQTAWDDWAADTNCFPDCFTITRGPKLWANFRLSNFAQHVAMNLNAALIPTTGTGP